jgi:nicotinate phosphoribosyltransferase
MPDLDPGGDVAWPPLESSALLVDAYELTMTETYLARQMTDRAAFEIFVRRLPPTRNYLVAAGLEPALTFVETFHFSPRELAWLRESHGYGPALLAYLAGVRFSGDVDAVPEGTIVFANEPILRITAPLPEAQLLETRILNLIHVSTLVASKASRMVTAAMGRPLIDFGLRRAHGAEAGMLAARAAFIAGFAGTSNVLAGARYGVPTFGTMAHSFVQAHDDESAAFEHFALSHPENVVLLIDTYDTEAGAAKVVGLAAGLRARGITIQAVRIDSGDLATHARRVRRILDDGGLPEVKIVASGGLDELAIAALVDTGAPIDTFAPGTALVTSSDAPQLDCAYKLVEYAGRPRHKRSEGKLLWPGAKQVFRSFGPDDCIADRLTLASESAPGRPLLEPVLRNGRRLHPPPPLDALRGHATAERARLPRALSDLAPAPAPPLCLSSSIESLLQDSGRSG